MKISCNLFKRCSWVQSFGIFTYAPRSYAHTVLNEDYKFVRWDVIVGHEDVRNRKPHRDGIHLTMDKLGSKDLSKTLLVGDNDVDVKSAYNAGIAIAVDTTSWSSNYTRDKWGTLNHVPDILFKDPSDVISALEARRMLQPDLERVLSGFVAAPKDLRFERCARRLHKDVGGGKQPYQIYRYGRSFAGHKSLSNRTKWHALTNSSHDNNECDSFPNEWIGSIYRFVRIRVPNLCIGSLFVVSVVPHRLGRSPRLDCPLGQLRVHINANPFPKSAGVQYKPELLAYRAEVKCNSSDKLNALDRFKNVRDHLYVNQLTAVAAGNGL